MSISKTFPANLSIFNNLTAYNLTHNTYSRRLHTPYTMSINLANMPTGTYTYPQIVYIAAQHFLDEYAALIDHAELAWEDVSIPGLSAKALFMGYIKKAGELHKVLACMASDGGIYFFTRSGAYIKSRRDWGRFQLVAPWTYLAERKERPQLVVLQTMVQFFFASAGHAQGVAVMRKGWFRSLEVGCRLMGQGMGMLPGGLEVVAVDGGYEGGDEAGEAPGMQVKKSARIVQRLVGMARRVNGHWAAHVEKELKVAWPGLKKHWRK